MKRVPVIILCAVLLAAVHLDSSGTHLLPVLVGMAFVQGSLLVVAATELSNGKWLKQVKRPLLSVAPLLFLFPLLVKLAPYAWREHPNRWLEPNFFLGRDFAVLLLVAIVGNIFRRIALAESPSVGRWAVAYILTFVAAKTLVVMDWVMSFDYPWISTMFPVLYMVETFSAGLVLLAFICFMLHRRQAGSVDAVLFDGATLMFGFALFWGGLSFAQYLTIWYGNIPEEVHFFTSRFALPGGPALFAAFIVLLFGIPFTSLLVHNVRNNVSAVFFIGLVITAGLFLSRSFHVFPHIHLNFGFFALQLMAMLGIVALVVRDSLSE